MVLGGYQIPSGTKVVTAGMVISNDEDHFDRPDEFIPERWIRGNPLQNTADPFAFLPFGRGPRCSLFYFSLLTFWEKCRPRCSPFFLVNLGKTKLRGSPLSFLVDFKLCGGDKQPHTFSDLNFWCSKLQHTQNTKFFCISIFSLAIEMAHKKYIFHILIFCLGASET